MPFLERWVFKILGRSAHLLNFKINKGLASLTREKAKLVLADSLKRYSSSVERISKKIFYVTSSAHPLQMSDLVDCMGWYIHTYYGKSDGLVLLKDQSIENIGVLLIHLNADHAALTTTFPYSNQDAKIRIALTRAIVKFTTQSDR